MHVYGIEIILLQKLLNMMFNSIKDNVQRSRYTKTMEKNNIINKLVHTKNRIMSVT